MSLFLIVHIVGAIVTIMVAIIPWIISLSKKQSADTFTLLNFLTTVVVSTGFALLLENGKVSQYCSKLILYALLIFLTQIKLRHSLSLHPYSLIFFSMLLAQGIIGI